MTIDVDAGKLGLAIEHLRCSAEVRGMRAIEFVKKGDVEHAFFYAEWAASIANASIAIDEAQKQTWGARIEGLKAAL
jgi:hypothetical protein